MAIDEKIIVPVWHNVEAQDILAFSPPLADKFAVVSKDRGPEDIATEVLRAIRPDLEAKMSLFRMLMRRPGPEDEILRVSPDELAMAPLPKVFEAEGHVVIRAANVVSTLGRAHPRIVGDLTTFLSDLYRDLHPEVELREWERMTAVFLVVDGAIELSPAERERLVSLVLMLSLGNFDELERTQLPSSVAALTAEKWQAFSKFAENERVRFSTGG
ncbi:hypothetical protein MUY14_42910 [Amycolatopsis sp. FBCC-B4732]|uniref:hypothetical protein n=1 Tax=Amycolatopsis sp. FBCC-B4732 TaxID=3079339 RepID=UPI001FF20FE0|nr:hypothetical protein [Amycolatopsis sp. FBCC-B4732]UOX88365.1 hypothetical protein MUY14_42910 [Amycolatopsis sp. FBCC-B4732]